MELQGVVIIDLEFLTNRGGVKTATPLPRTVLSLASDNSS